MHGGTCKDLSADYNCTCAPGYTGKNCSVGKGSCDSDIKQLLDEVEHDIMNYQNRGLCYLPKPKAEADNTDMRF